MSRVLISFLCVAIAGVLQFYLKPRLPLYTITPLLWKQLPKLRMLDDGWTIEILSQMEFFNENYIHLDVYSLLFEIVDVYESSTVGKTDGTSSRTMQKRILATITGSYDQQQPVAATLMKPMWSVNARSNFTAVSSLQIRLSFHNFLSSITSLVKRTWYGSGQMTLPTIGAAHMKVSPTSSLSNQAVAMTLSLICDNTLNAFSMKIFGTHCIIQKVQPGWIPMDIAASSVRQYAFDKLQGNTTSGELLN